MSYEYGDPCPDCGHAGHFQETCLSHGVSYFDDDGNVIDYKEGHVGQAVYVECPECNTVLMDKLDRQA